MAVEQREAARGETVIHSDHGTQFTSWAFTRARTSALVPSKGLIGDCNDNALIEALWVTDADRAARHAGRRASNSASREGIAPA